MAATASSQDHLAEVELRLYRLEMKLLGTETSVYKTSTVDTESKRKTATPNPTTATRLSFEDELAVLDKGTQLPKIITSTTTSEEEMDDLASRLSKLEQIVDSSKSSSQRDILEGHWNEMNQYLQDLDPGAALTHQQSIGGPLIYRRQEVLASADELKRNMQYVSEILNLLMIGQNMPPLTFTSSSSSSATTSAASSGVGIRRSGGSSSSTNSSSSSSKPVAASSNDGMISEMHVTKAPILLTAPALSREQQDELVALGERLQLLRDRVDASSTHLDRLVTGYQDVITAISEKLVLLDEELRLQNK